jgi:hypothetical protein
MENDRVRHLATSPRADVAYLHAIRPVVAGVTRARHGWIREIGVLLEEARRSTPPAIAAAAGEIGRAHLPRLLEARARIQEQSPPHDCLAINRAAVAWLDAQVAACETMLDVGATGDVRRLKGVQQALAEGRQHAHRFNEQYERLVGDIRALVDAAARRRQRREQRVADRQLAAVG